MAHRLNPRAPTLGSPAVVIADAIRSDWALSSNQAGSLASTIVSALDAAGYAIIANPEGDAA